MPGPLPATELSCELAHLNSSTSPGEETIIPILQRYTLKLRETLYLARALCYEALGLKFHHTGHVNKVRPGNKRQPNQKKQKKQRKSAFGCLIPMRVPLFLGVGSQELFRGIILYPVKLGVG